MGIANIIVEAGPKLLSSFIRQKLADKYIFFIAPKLLADKTGLVIDSGKKKKISGSMEFKNVSYRILGKEIMMEAYA